jgi:hypothetical protein
MASYNYSKFVDEIVQLNADASDVITNGDTIADVLVPVISGTITISNIGLSGSLISFRVAGGLAGQYAYAVVQLTLASGLYRESPVQILVKPLPGV